MSGFMFDSYLLPTRIGVQAEGQTRLDGRKGKPENEVPDSMAIKRQAVNSKGANRSNYALGLTEWIVRTRLLVRYGQNMSQYKVGDHVQVKLSGGRIVPGDHQGRRRNDRGCALAGVIWRGDSADLSVADQRGSLIVICRPSS
jgi:hypothetical protein